MKGQTITIDTGQILKTLLMDLVDPRYKVVRLQMPHSCHATKSGTEIRKRNSVMTCLFPKVSICRIDTLSDSKKGTAVPDCR